MVHLLVSLLITSGQASTLKTPYTNALDLSPVEKALQQKPEAIVRYIESYGVRVFKTEKAKRLNLPVNPIFAKTKVAPPKDLKRCDIDTSDDNSEDGGFLQKNLTFCKSSYDWIYISDSSSTITLIHEFMHFLFYKAESKEDLKISGDIAEKLRQEHRSMQKNFEALSADEDLMNTDHYRKNFLASCLAFSKTFKDGVRLQLSEEIIIERTLQELTIGTRYFDKVRLEKGKTYAQNNLNAVADMAVRFEDMTDWVDSLHLSLSGEALQEFQNSVLEIKNASVIHYQMHKALADYTALISP